MSKLPKIPARVRTGATATGSGPRGRADDVSGVGGSRASAERRTAASTTTAVVSARSDVQGASRSAAVKGASDGEGPR